jgi:Flp pilus assembly pilin Flp
MTTNERAKRLITGIEHGLIGAALLAITLIVHTATFKDEVAAEHERQGNRYQDCKCKTEIKGQQLVASLCQAPTILGPWDHECIYKREKQ